MMKNKKLKMKKIMNYNKNKLIHKKNLIKTKKK